MIKINQKTIAALAALYLAFTGCAFALTGTTLTQLAPTTNLIHQQLETVTRRTLPGFPPHIWPQSRHDGQNTGRSSYKGPAAPGLLWSSSIDTTGPYAASISCPVIDNNGIIYVGGGGLQAFNQDGTRKWKYYDDSNTYYYFSSIRYSSPIMGSSGTIYCAVGLTSNYDSAKPIIYAVNPDGTQKWRYIHDVYDPSYKVRSQFLGMTVNGNTVYTVMEVAHYTGDNYNSGNIVKRRNHLLAINDSGAVVWSYEIPVGIFVYSPPAVASDGTIYVGVGYAKPVYYSYGSGMLYAINPDGSEKWRIEVDDNVYASPAIASDGTIYVGTGMSLYAVNPTNGSIKWNTVVGGYASGIMNPPAIGPEGNIYIARDYVVYAVNPTDGSTKWKVSVGGYSAGAPAIDSQGILYVSNVKKGKIYIVDPKDEDKIDTYGYIPARREYPLPVSDWRENYWFASTPAIGTNKTIYVMTGHVYDGRSALYAINDIDTTPPTGSVAINNGNPYTTSSSVTLNISGSDNLSGIGEMMISGDITDGFKNTWIAYAASQTVNLTSGDGNKTITVKFRDRSGNESSVYQDSIILDTTPPVADVTLTGDKVKDVGGTKYINTRYHVTVSFSNIVEANGVAIMRFSGDISDSLKNVDWAFATQKDYIALTAGEGEKAINVEIEDSAGNKTSYTRKIALDTVAPSVSIIGPSGTVQNISKIKMGASDANLEKVEARIKENRNGQYYYWCRYPDGHFDWYGPQGYNWDGDSGYTVWHIVADTTNWELPVSQIGNPAWENNKTYYIRARAIDKAGNSTICNEKDATININGGIISNITTNPIAVNSSVSSFDITFSVDVDLIEDPEVTVVGNPAVKVSQGWKTYTYRYTVIGNEGEGAREISIQGTDGGGSPVSGTGSIAFDFTPPSGDVVNNDHVNSRYDLRLTFENLSEVIAKVQITGDITDFFNDGTYLSYPSSNYKDVDLTSGDGAKRITVIFKDAAGNVSDPIEKVVVLDAVNPGVAINAPSPGTYSSINTISGTASDDRSGIDRVEVAIRKDYKYWDGSGFNASSACWLPANGTDNWSYDCSAVNWIDGEYSIRARSHDKAGNVTPLASWALVDGVVINQTLPPATQTHTFTLVAGINWISIPFQQDPQTGINDAAALWAKLGLQPGDLIEEPNAGYANYLRSYGGTVYDPDFGTMVTIGANFQVSYGKCYRITTAQARTLAVTGTVLVSETGLFNLAVPPSPGIYWIYIPASKAGITYANELWSNLGLQNGELIEEPRAGGADYPNSYGGTVYDPDFGTTITIGVDFSVSQYKCYRITVNSTKTWPRP